MSQDPAPLSQYGKQDLALIANEKCQSSSKQAELHPTVYFILVLFLLIVGLGLNSAGSM